MFWLTKSIIPGLLIALLTGLVAISAQAESMPSRGPIPFAAFDQDNDGFVSEDEFYRVRGERMAARAAEGRPMYGAADAPSFAEIDGNGDGKLTPAELTAGQQAHMKRRQMMGMGRGLGPDQAVGMGRNKPAFGDFDLNGDGMLDAQEFDEAHNKRVAERAQQGYPMKNRANPPAFDELDTNGDGAVSPQEFAAHQAQRVPQNESE